MTRGPVLSTYELQVKPLEDGSYALQLWEHPPNDTHGKSNKDARKVSEIAGWHLSAVHPLVTKVLKGAGYKAFDLKRSRRAPFRLDDEQGARLDLAFKAIRPMSRRSRIDRIVQGVARMPREEAFYWHSKATPVRPLGPNPGLRAFRMLMGED